MFPVETSKLDLTQTNSVGAELLPVDENCIRNRLILWINRIKCLGGLTGKPESGCLMLSASYFHKLWSLQISHPWQAYGRSLRHAAAAVVQRGDLHEPMSSARNSLPERSQMKSVINLRIRPWPSVWHISNFRFVFCDSTAIFVPTRKFQDEGKVKGGQNIYSVIETQHCSCQRTSQIYISEYFQK